MVSWPLLQIGQVQA